MLIENETQKKHINIGLDIGTTSVGWAIIDTDFNVIDYGVRLFEDTCEEKTGHPKNEQRRIKRCQRRLLRRRKHHKERFINLVLKYKDIFLFNSQQEIKTLLEKTTDLPWDVKVKGLTNKLTKNELIYILYHYLSHRGFTYLNESSDSDEKIKLDYVPKWIKDTIEKEKFVKLSFPCQKQQYVFNKLKLQDKDLNRSFSLINWKNEIKKILSNQNYLSSDFNDQHIKLFSSFRDYAIGPGSEKSPTPYGLWSKTYDKNKKEWICTSKGNNLWDTLIGTCSFFDGANGQKPEKRIEMSSASAIIFNLLNQLQNLKILNKKARITVSEKKQIFNDLFNTETKTTKLTIKKLASFFGCNSVDISGFNKAQKDIFHDISNIKFGLKFLNIDSLSFATTLWSKNFEFINQLTN